MPWFMAVIVNTAQGPFPYVIKLFLPRNLTLNIWDLEKLSDFGISETKNDIWILIVNRIAIACAHKQTLACARQQTLHLNWIKNSL